MKLFAIAAPTIVLVSLCGSAVAPPGAEVSGTVYRDVNFNAIRDDCDAPLAEKSVAAIAEDGTVVSGVVDDLGNFHLSDVPAGDVLITMAPEPGRTWPVTTIAEDGRRGVSLALKGLEEIEGIELGVATPYALQDTDSVVLGIAFNDADDDGKVDANECGIPLAAARPSSGQTFHGLRDDGTFEIHGAEGVNGVVVAATGGSQRFIGFDLPGEPGGFASQGDPCSVEVVPAPVFAPNIYQALAPIAPPDSRTGTVTGVVWDDADDNGVKDEGERTLPNIQAGLYLSYWCQQPSGEKDMPQPFATTDAEGRFTMTDVPAGYYTAFMPNVPEMSNAATIVVLGREPGYPLAVREGETTTVDVPLRFLPAGSARVFVFEDEDGDGAFSPGETPAHGAHVCLAKEPAAAGPRGDEGSVGLRRALFDCDGPGSAGFVDLGPVEAGEYQLQVSPPPHLVGSPGPIVPITIVTSETTELHVPIAVVRLSEIALDPGIGESVEFTLCYDDPGWVQPEFDPQYEEKEFRFPTTVTVDESTAREIYARGIYPMVSGWLEYQIWGELAGFRGPALVPGCIYTLWHGPSGDGITVHLVGYEPVDVKRAEDVAQLRVRAVAGGLRTVVFQPGQSGRCLPHQAEGCQEEFHPQAVVIVDENYNPLIACGQGGCK